MRHSIRAGLAAALLVAAAPVWGQRGPRFEPLEEPKFVPAAQADFLADNDRVLGVEGNGAAKAYPVEVAAWHHIIHDRLGGLPILPTW